MIFNLALAISLGAQIGIILAAWLLHVGLFSPPAPDPAPACQVWHCSIT